ncbi:MAG: flagellar hook assembly protein FlgD [Trichlorobacter sp.]
MSTTITGTTATTSTYAADAMKQSVGMNKDDFLQLFMAQLQHQDPLSPQDPTEFLGQLAQLTQVEQAYNTSATLEKLLAAQDNSMALSSVALIGKQVAALGTQAAFDGTNPATLSYQMPATTASTTLKITNASGQTVRQVDLGSVTVGNGSYQWDGKDGQGNLLPAGAYNFGISGTDALGTTQIATTYTTGKADGVRFENGMAYVTIGAVSVPFADVTTVKEA